MWLRQIKRTIILLFVALLLPVHGWAVQNELDTDSFNGTNGTALATYNANWNALGSGEINQAAIQGTPGVGNTSGNSGDYRTGQTWTNNQWAELIVDGT